VNLRPPEDLARLLRSVPELGQAYLVGGCVRDALLGQPVKDFDLEVFGVDYETLATALRRHGRVDVVGRSFGVAKLSLGQAVHDFSLPRRDSKVGPGHQGFEIRFDPGISPREAAARRDFTVNALMYDPRTGGLLDFFGGVQDLRARVLRHTGPAFVEDPLRVLRGMQFAGRFDLAPAPETVDLCRTIAGTYPELARERVRGEWFKWAGSSRRPSAGLLFLEAAGWLGHFPELAALRHIPQDAQWHPEGDVLTHTCHALDALVELPAWKDAPEADRIVLSLAVLAHDFGKATCTQTVLREGRPRIVSPGHEVAGAGLAEAFLARIQAPNAVVERVLPLVTQHMAHFQAPTPRAIRRLARRLQPETVTRLCVVMTADAHGRPPLPRVTPDAVEAIRGAARDLAVEDAAPRPILLGRHLLALGFPAGPGMGHWLEAAFEAQLDGEFADLPGAHAWLTGQKALPDDLRERARGQAGS